jgi:hypothetical protein
MGAGERAGERAGGSGDENACVLTRVGDRLPGMGNEKTLSRFRTESSSGDIWRG